MTDAGKKRIDYVCLIYCLAYLHGMCMTFIENVFLIDVLKIGDGRVNIITDME